MYDRVTKISHAIEKWLVRGNTSSWLAERLLMTSQSPKIGTILIFTSQSPKKLGFNDSYLHHRLEPKTKIDITKSHRLEPYSFLHHRVPKKLGFNNLYLHHRVPNLDKTRMYRGNLEHIKLSKD